MIQPDLEGAINFASRLLDEKLPAELYYHSAAHTQVEVLWAAERLAALQALDDQSFMLLKTAVYFHDVGYTEQREQHEEISRRIAAQVLPGFGYLPSQVQAIESMILATRLPQSPQTLAEMILADADLSTLGRDTFLVRSADLRAERQAYGEKFTTLEWYLVQLDFLARHHYFTPAAKNLFNTQKQVNMDTLQNLIDELRRSAGSVKP